MSQASFISSLYKERTNCDPDAYVKCKERIRSNLFKSFEPLDSSSILSCFDRTITDFCVSADARLILISGYFPSKIHIHGLKYPLYDNISTSIASSSSLKSPVTQLQWYPHDSGMFLSISKTKLLRIWDTENLKESHKIPLFDTPLCFQMSTVDVSHYCVAIGLKNRSIQIFNFKSGNFMMSLIGHKSPVSCISWSKCNDNLFSSGDLSGAILVWDIRNNKTFVKCLNQYEKENWGEHGRYYYAHDGAVSALCSNIKSNSLISCGSDRTVKVWDMVNMRRLKSFSSQSDIDYNVSIDCTASHPNNTLDGDLIFIPGSERPIAVELYSGKEKSDVLKVNECSRRKEVKICQLHPHLPCIFTADNSRFVQIWMSQYAMKNRYQNPLYEDTWSDD